MSQIIIKTKGGEHVRTIEIPAEGLTIKELAEHLSEVRAGKRPQPYDRVTLGRGSTDNPTQVRGGVSFDDVLHGS